jgi:hypothetical protein
VRVASCFPFHATYWLNGHSFMEQELNRKQIVFQKATTLFWRWTMWLNYRRPPTG